MYHKGKPFLSQYSSVKKLFFQEFHSIPSGGYTGITKTITRFQANAYWVGMRKEVEEFVTSCPTCQRTKYLPRAPLVFYNRFHHLLAYGRYITHIKGTPLYWTLLIDFQNMLISETYLIISQCIRWLISSLLWFVTFMVTHGV